jgi:hypothetical protein
MKQRFAICAALALGVLVIAGCGGAQGPKPVGVSGTVYIDDKPAPNIAVFFVTEKHAGTGRTNAEGKYTLAQGAIPGVNKITFNAAEESKKSDVEMGMDAGQMEAQATGAPGGASGAVAKKKAAGATLPERYSDAS